jgi:hypothetical protein
LETSAVKLQAEKPESVNNEAVKPQAEKLTFSSAVESYIDEEKLEWKSLLSP